MNALMGFPLSRPVYYTEKPWIWERAWRNQPVVEAEETHVTDLTQKGVASASLGCGKPKLSTQPNTYQIPAWADTEGIPHIPRNTQLF